MVGAAGLTSTAPAAYYVVTGYLDITAWALWAANLLFAINQIQFVQIRIHASMLSSAWARSLDMPLTVGITTPRASCFSFRA